MMILDDTNFEAEIAKSQKPMVIDFWAEWCGPCQMLGPVMEKVAEEYKDKIAFAKVNVDASPLVSQKYEIAQIPTVMLFKEGKPASAFIGARPEDFVKAWLNENL
jgi:thioredoxin 1